MEDVSDFLQLNELQECADVFKGTIFTDLLIIVH